MAVVYSAPLIIELGLTTEASFTVPEGFTCVVRDIDVYANGAAVPPFTYFFAQGTLGQAFFYYEWTEITQAWSMWRGRHVMPAGEILVAQANNGAIDVSICGYLLQST